VPAQAAPHAVLRDAQATPLLGGELGGDPARAEAGMGKREGEDALLQVRAELVGHARLAPFPDAQRLQPPTIG
jgi:hypothetical protein